jgi:hypothetical protein
MLSRPPSGHTERPAVVVEVYDRERPGDADRLLRPIMDELGGHMVLVGESVGKGYEVFHSQPGIGVDPAVLDGLANRARRGFEEWTQARFEEAVRILDDVAATARDAPAALLMEAELRGAYRKALVGLALAHKRLGHQAEATETMAELVRSFSDAPLEAMEFGQEAFRLYLVVKASLSERGSGTLLVRVDDPDVIVFVNEQYLAQPERGKRLPPGTYRVQIRRGGTLGRAYRARIQAGRTTTVEVSWRMDQTLHSSPNWTGFLFPDAASRERLLARYALAFARAYQVQTVITLGVVRDESRRRVFGKVFRINATGPGRTASVAVEPVEPTDDHLRALGAYLAGAASQPPLPEPALTRDLSASAATRGLAGRRLLFWGGLAGGVIAVGLGAYFILTDGHSTCGDPTRQCERVYTTKNTTIGLVTMTAGATAACTSGVLLWRTRARRGPVRGVAVTLGAIHGIAVSGEF